MRDERQAERRRALAHLRAADPVMAAVIDRVGPCRYAPARSGTHFDALVRSIVYQQLSGRAAAAIMARVKALFGGRPPGPAEVAAASGESLRAAGLSRRKTEYLKDLAARALAGEVPVERLHALDDAAVIEALSRVKGIGLWTAQVFLIFRLGRPDVLPATDLGIRKAVMRAYGLRALPAPARVLEIGACWRPYATFASWYLWRSIDGAAAI
jgi:DNA-3-methyladenine glycosylase II